MSTGVATAGIIVIGLGNVFLSDDGFGPLAVEIFRCAYEYEADVEVEDLGTPGLDLAPYLYDRRLVVVVDAVHTDLAPGTLSLLSEEDFMSSHAKLRITGHDPGLWDSLAHLRLAGGAPEKLIVIGLTPESCDFGGEFHAKTLARAEEAARMIAEVLAEHGCVTKLRSTPQRPNLWWLPVSLPDSLAMA